MFVPLFSVLIIGAILDPLFERLLPSVEEWPEKIFFTCGTIVMIFHLLLSRTNLRIEGDGSRIVAEFSFWKWIVFRREQEGETWQLATRGERWLAYAARSLFSRLEVVTASGEKNVVLGMLGCWIYGVSDEIGED